MAHAHYMYPSTFLNLYIKNTRQNSYTRKDLDFYNNQEFFEILESKSILSKGELLKMSLRSMEGYLFINQGLYPPHQIRRLIDKRTHFGLMYCPKCLKEDEVPYWRKKWRYFYYTACPKHKVFLTDRCWHCYKPIKLLRVNIADKLTYCSNCGADLSLTETHQDIIPDPYGLKAIKWFEKGLKKGYFEINKQKVWSTMFFHIFCRLHYLLEIEQNLMLKNFPMLNEYKFLSKKLEIYNSKKASAIYKSFYLNSMVYSLFQDFPAKFLNFIKLNHLTNKRFTYGFKNIPYWYEQMLENFIPKENKKGRVMSKSEVIGAIKYLKQQGEVVNQLNVAETVGCHSTIHKGFNGIYKRILKLMK